LQCSPWGERIEYFSKLDSTSLYLKQQARAGAPAGRVVVAAEQSAGYGRRGRQWHSPAGLNLYFSVLLRPRLDYATVPRLSLVTAAALKLALDDICPGLKIKWPNDLFAGGRKLAGILAEMEPGADGPAFVVIGVGLNVNACEEDFPPELAGQVTSLRLASGCRRKPENLLPAILEELARLVGLFQRQGLAREIMALINDNFHLAGREVVLYSGTQEIVGRALGIDAVGRLRLETPTGECLAFSAGEARIKKSR
jgi:BirA family biotin operon repressor/biotin-[acetyl-CoA-carboxylase] ligase